MPKKLDLSIIIPTRNRLKLLIRTVNQLSKNSFFFKDIIIVDSSDSILKKKIFLIKKKFKKIKINIYNSKPSISKQRNIGIAKIKKKREYIMFLDDDIKFQKDSLNEMYKFISKNKDYAGIGFNLIDKKSTKLDLIKKNIIFKFLGIYDPKPGYVTKSGWHTKAKNLKRNTPVNWLSTQAVIYKKLLFKGKKFNTQFGPYSYLEDLDFSFGISKRHNLIIISKAKYHADNTINRNSINFGFIEILNRYIFIKKFELSNTCFYIGVIFLTIKNILKCLQIKKNNILQFAGNLKAIFYILFILKKNFNKLAKK
jgi:glycosyltransferase involved in cell wall biosynthesis